jgi:hypothetical protein
MMNRNSPIILLTVFLFFTPGSLLFGQMITGSWKGKINRQRVEVKIIQNGDSLTGTSYYYESATNYRRYTIKGYFDAGTNSAVWWDDQLIEEKSGRFTINTPGKIPMLSRADFNCPGGGRMMLDGKAAKKEDEMKITGDVHLDKTEESTFNDEWDYVIENFTIGANDPEIIDSIEAIASKVVEEPDPQEEPEPVKVSVVKKEPVSRPAEPAPKVITPVEKTNPPITTPAPTIQDKFLTRKKVLTKEIPLAGDSVELRFYDNAEIDGDSISLFLNGRLLFEHIRLTGSAYIIKLAVGELGEDNELTMVAENLGAIPPNTSYMLAIVEEKRYDVYLASTEGSSAMIRFTKK